MNQRVKISREAGLIFKRYEFKQVIVKRDSADNRYYEFIFKDFKVISGKCSRPDMSFDVEFDTLKHQPVIVFSASEMHSICKAIDEFKLISKDI